METFALRRALLCGECVIPVDRAPPRHQNLRSAHGSLYRRFSSCAWRHYVETLVLCKTPYPLGARSPLYEGGSAFADENWVRFVIRASRSTTSRRGCFAVLILCSVQSRSGGELPLSGTADRAAVLPNCRLELSMAAKVVSLIPDPFR